MSAQTLVAPRQGTPEATEPTGTAALRSLVLEHCMRLVPDDTSVMAFLDPAPGTHEAAAALGRFLTEHRITLCHGSPLSAFVRGGEVTPTWRIAYPARPDSLWHALEQHRREATAPPAAHGDPLAELYAYQHAA